ncbi:hypothetical protein [Azovibrio restrictus]|uniref:hypothetical protein n=1 Tax=Azovibrio restrictus TaxID=146938 RepID=UPI0012EB8E0D|nr:hypothetical protein [Azovibrio restrictus]
MSYSIQDVMAMVDDPMQRTWIDPSSVTGFDVAAVFRINEERYFTSDGCADEESETEDEIIQDYLMNCILSLEQSGNPVNAVTILNAAIFLIEKLGCRQVAHIWPFVRKYFDAQTFSLAYSKIRNIYEGSDSDFVRLLLADFTLDLFPSDDPQQFCMDVEKQEFLLKLQKFRKLILLSRVT